MKRVLLLIISILLVAGASAQTKAKKPVAPDANKTRVLLILDCSNSMWDRWQSDAKIKVTQKVLLKFLDSVANQNDIEVALRVFGHLNKNAYGTRLEVPFGANNNYQIQSKIKTLVPNGGCTVSTALENSLNDFPVISGTSSSQQKDQQARNIILIITDGMDDCDGSICQVARQVQMSGVIVQTFILGIGNPKDFQSNLDCAGKFSYIPDEENYTQALYDIFRLSEEESQLVIKLTDEEGHLYEAATPVALYDSQTKVVKYSTIYSIDDQYTPDTLVIDPLVAYDIEIFTQPPTMIRDLKLEAGKLNQLNLTIEQGGLRIRHEDIRTNLALPSYPVIVREKGKSQVLNIQNMGDQVTYLAGQYDLEILCEPPLRLPGITIQNNSSTDLTIPMPGVVNVQKPKTICTGSIFSLQEGRMVWICDMNPSKANERFLLMPGEYQMVLKPQSSTLYKESRSKRFEVRSAQTTNITF